MKRLGFSSLALGTLVGAISGATLSHPIVARAAEPMRLAEAEMERITAGATLSQTTGASVGSASPGSATVQSRQHQNGRTLRGGGALITGIGFVLGTANGSSTSGRTILSADASGDVAPAGTVGGIVDVPDRTVAYGATWGAAVDLPLRPK